MDSLTHALVAAILAYALGFPQLLPFAVLGTVIIDTDVLFSLISDRQPSLYLFTHGGIVHSLAGAAVLSVIAFAGMNLAVLTGFIDPAVLVRAGAAGFAAVLAGAFLHIGLDLPACPASQCRGYPTARQHGDAGQAGSQERAGKHGASSRPRTRPQMDKNHGREVIPGNAMTNLSRPARLWTIPPWVRITRLRSENKREAMQIDDNGPQHGKRKEGLAGSRSRYARMAATSA